MLPNVCPLDITEARPRLSNSTTRIGAVLWLHLCMSSPELWRGTQLLTKPGLYDERNNSLHLYATILDYDDFEV